ncbi:MAG: hypothetical protein N2316_02035 [Spirochaetes bacterium]|nr:hypothetical protein [Spirochaetota bacterium]
MKKGCDEIKIIEQFCALPNESPLSRDEFALFYESFVDRDDSMLLSNGKSSHVFYFTSYDLVEEIIDEDPLVFFENFENRVRCIIVFNPQKDHVTAFLVLDLKDEEHKRFLKELCIMQKINFHFISLLYGDLYKMKSFLIAVPPSALEIVENVL